MKTFIRIGRTLNATLEEIEQRKFNVYVGISLGNRYFTKTRVRAFLQWGLEVSKDDVAVLIADDVHAINLEALKSYSPESAKRSAEQSGDQTANMVQSIINGLPQQQQSLVHILRWRDVRSDTHYPKRLAAIIKEFNENNEFHDTIIRIVRETFEGEVPLEKLAQYVLHELPPFLFGITHGDTRYTVLPYPGLSAIDELVAGMQNRSAFPNLADILRLEEKTVFVEAFAD